MPTDSHHQLWISKVPRDWVSAGRLVGCSGGKPCPESATDSVAFMRIP